MNRSNRILTKAELRRQKQQRANGTLPPIIYCCDYTVNGVAHKELGDLRNYPKGWASAKPEQRIGWWKDYVKLERRLGERFPEASVELTGVTIYADYSMIPREYKERGTNG